MGGGGGSNSWDGFECLNEWMNWWTKVRMAGNILSQLKICILIVKMKQILWIVILSGMTIHVLIYIRVTEYCFIWSGSVFRWIEVGKNVRNQARQKDGKNIILIKGMFFFTL